MHKILFALLLSSVAILAPAAKADDATSKPLDLKFTAGDGKEIDLVKMRGKVVLIDFWATWCPPCRAEVPHVVELYKKFHDQGLEIVGISLDKQKNTMLDFTANHGMTWPQYFDGKGWDNEISSSFGISEIPTMVLVGKDGKVVAPGADEDLTA